jgi:hypothetical protein
MIRQTKKRRKADPVLPFRQRTDRILAVCHGAGLWKINECVFAIRLASIIDSSASLFARTLVTNEYPKAAWFRSQALECVMFALRANDVRIKRLQVLEAERWLRLAELKRALVESDRGPIAAE